MIHIKPFPGDTKKMNLSTPMEVKKKSANKKVKPSNKKLDGEKFLSKKDVNTRKGKSPSSKNIDGEKFLSDDIKVKKFNDFK